MKRSIASVCLSGDLRQKIEAVAEAGYDGIEIFENDFMLFGETPATVRRMVEDAELEIVAFQPFRDFECMPKAKMQKNFDRAERKFDLMEELGTKAMLICSNVSPQCIDDTERAVEEFYELAERAKKRDITLGYEALAWGRNVSLYEQAWDIVKRVDHKNLGIILDSFHMYARDADLATVAEIPGNRIVLVQVADAPRLKMDVLQWSRHFRCFPGQGDFAMQEFMSAIIKTGYNGYFSHEIFNDEFRSSPCRATAIDGMRSLLWLQEQVVMDEPDLMLDRKNSSFYQPPKADMKNFEFVEFAADDQMRDELLGMLQKLGFRRSHKHRSKEVSLYRQGDVSLVINEESDSFAQHYSLVHGTSVCAIAYGTDDAEGMAERADYYGYHPFESDVESGELDIPAIKSITGELVYFVQKNTDGTRFYDVDFVADDNSEALVPADESLNFDHVSSGVAETEFLSVSLFYRSLLDLDVAQPQDLIDPYGIVVSRAATNQDKRIRLPFNMSRSWGASTERFRELHRGSGVQHIAMSCDDIRAFVRRVDADIILPIPANYYDDLEARFDLDDDLLADLRQFNMLYDQNETGYFIHFYTRSINGLFFEVLQRHRYGNYGEANSQVRLAAQAQVRRSGQP